MRLRCCVSCRVDHSTLWRIIGTSTSKKTPYPCRSNPRVRPVSDLVTGRVLEANGTRELPSMVIQVGEKEQNIQDVETTFSLAAK